MPLAATRSLCQPWHRHAATPAHQAWGGARASRPGPQSGHSASADERELETPGAHHTHHHSGSRLWRALAPAEDTSQPPPPTRRSLLLPGPATTPCPQGGGRCCTQCPRAPSQAQGSPSCPIPKIPNGLCHHHEVQVGSSSRPAWHGPGSTCRAPAGGRPWSPTSWSLHTPSYPDTHTALGAVLGRAPGSAVPTCQGLQLWL